MHTNLYTHKKVISEKPISIPSTHLDDLQLSIITLSPTTLWCPYSFPFEPLLPNWSASENDTSFLLQPLTAAPQDRASWASPLSMMEWWKAQSSAGAHSCVFMVATATPDLDGGVSWHFSLSSSSNILLAFSYKMLPGPWVHFIFWDRISHWPGTCQIC